MKLDWFVAQLGASDAELSQEHRALALLKAEEFLRVGRLSPMEWNALSEESREIFLEASEKLKADEMRAIAEGVRITLDLNGLE